MFFEMFELKVRELIDRVVGSVMIVICGFDIVFELVLLEVV